MPPQVYAFEYIPTIPLEFRPARAMPRAPTAAEKQAVETARRVGPQVWEGTVPDATTPAVETVRTVMVGTTGLRATEVRYRVSGVRRFYFFGLRFKNPEELEDYATLFQATLNHPRVVHIRRRRRLGNNSTDRRVVVERRAFKVRREIALINYYDGVLATVAPFDDFTVKKLRRRGLIHPVRV